MSVDPVLAARAAAWAEDDPVASDAAEVRSLLAAGDEAALLERFGSRLEFGTAGLRGPLGAGPARMNVALVRRAAAGLVAWLDAGGAQGPLVVGHDARHGSLAFAEATAAVAAGAGREVALLPGPLPTPVAAFAVRHLAAAAGVVVTASHNPASDNGYKVYAADGGQIGPPADREISRAIDGVGALREQVLGVVPPAVEGVPDAYVAAALEAVAPLLPPAAALGALRLAWTPMHGVGGDTFAALLDRAGVRDHHVVAVQARPDPDFPTVAFPNPEEPGATDLLLRLAAEIDADLAIALDPDADRVALAVPEPATQGWRQLTGDEVGAVLGWWVVRRTEGDDRVVATTIVSSSLLATQAQAAGVAAVEVLTGFKWLARAGAPGKRLVYAYEEALGHCVAPGMVRDKDGMTGALALCGLVSHLAGEGRTVLDVLADLDRRFGAHATHQVSVRTPEPAAAVARLRESPPAALAGRAVDEVVDLAIGWRGLPPTDGLRLALAGGGRVVVRPSGTEPKVKAYVEVVAPDRVDATVAAAEVAGALRSLLEGA